MITDRSNLRIVTGYDHQDMDFVVPAIQATYFSNGRSHEQIIGCCRNSICYGLRMKTPDIQIAFARVITDFTTYSWIADVVVQPMYRKRGIGKILMQDILSDPAIAHTGFNLTTRDAQGFYAKFGFKDSVQMWRPSPLPENR